MQQDNAAPAAALPEVLRVDATLRNTNNWKRPDDVFNRFFRFPDGKGINNTSGFKAKSRAGGSTDITDCAFCILVSTFGETEWPDKLDEETGVFTYYGDNRSPGCALTETAIGGNRLLEHVFALLHTGRRAEIPPFLCFENIRTDDGAFMRFLGVAAPGAAGTSALEDLVAVWRIKGRTRFQNYRALFTIFAEETVPRRWLEDLVAGVPATTSDSCPRTWSAWIDSGRYAPLRCERTREPRTRVEQMPRSQEEQSVLSAVHSGLTDREFEFAAAEIVRLIDRRFSDLSVTRPVRDGGRDVLGSYQVGHDHHQVSLSVAVEAKRWDPASAVGVKPMMRLISRLKHRDVGVFVTTSFFDRQVQQELIDDNHPVLLVSGGDIARILIANELTEVGDGKLGAWLAGIRRSASTSRALR